MFAITGATGQLGRPTIEALLRRTPAAQIVALVRSPDRAGDLASAGVAIRRFDYDEPDHLADALAGVERLLLISSDDLGRRVGQHRAVLDAAVTAGVKFIAYTSVLHADDNPLPVTPSHLDTEAAVRNSGIPHAILRNGWYTENYLIGAEAAIAHGVLLGSAGAGRISGAARADYAEAAAAVLVEGASAAGVYELAGDTAFDLPDVAAAMAAASGCPVVYRDLPMADYAAALAEAGMPPTVATFVAELSAGAASNILADDSRTLSRLIGRPTSPLGEVVRSVLAGANP